MSINIRDLSSNRTDILYRDLDTVSKNRKTTGDGINVLENEAAIKQHIRNWLYTRKGQRPTNQGWGNKLFEFLFQPVSRTNARLIGQELDRLPIDVPSIVIVDINIEVIADGTGNKNGYNINFTYNTPTLDLFEQAFLFDFLQGTGVQV